MPILSVSYEYESLRESYQDLELNSMAIVLVVISIGSTNQIRGSRFQNVDQYLMRDELWVLTPNQDGATTEA